MPLLLPLPTAKAEDDPIQYIPLLLTAIEEFLEWQEVWAANDYADALGYMESLKLYLVGLLSGAVSTMQIGSMMLWPSDTVPEKWLLCDGADLLRADYSELFAIIGTSFGAGSDADHFNIPDFRDRSPMGVNSIVSVPGDTAGTETVTLTEEQMPLHRHGGVVTAGTQSPARAVVSSGGAQNVRMSDVTTPTGNSEPHNNVHPVLGCHFIIFAGV